MFFLRVSLSVYILGIGDFFYIRLSWGWCKVLVIYMCVFIGCRILSFFGGCCSFMLFFKVSCRDGLVGFIKNFCVIRGLIVGE